MNQQNDTTGVQGGDPEERAFTGHSDHPPAEPDHKPEDNQELLRESGGGEPASGEQGETEHRSPGEATTLPGYGG